MAFSGEIKELGMAGILQFISQNQMTGVLVLEEGDRTINLRFSEGKIVAALPTPELVGEMLVRVGLLGDDDLARALDVQKRTLQRLGDVLLRLDMVTQEDLAEVLQLQVREGVFKALEWKSGEFLFEPRVIEFDSIVNPRVEIEPLLLDGLRLVDELPILRSRLGSFDQIVRKVSAGAPDGFESPDEDGGDAEFTAQERVVHDMTNGRRSIQEVIDLSKMGEYQGCEALVSLLGRGRVELVPAWERETGTRKGLDWIGQSTGILLVLLLVALLLLALATGSPERGLLGGGAFSDTRFLQLLQYERVERALEIYKIENGAYPETLEDLVSTGILRTEDLAASWGGMVSYSLRGEGYNLIRWSGE